MTKKKFIEKVLTMTEPVLTDGSDPCWGLLNCYFHIRCTENLRNKLQLPGVRLSQGDLDQNGHDAIDAYYKRERCLALKYERWMHEVCGNYCTSRLGGKPLAPYV